MAKDKTNNEKIIAYCVRCKAKSEMVGGKKGVMSNGMGVIKGPCKKCGCKMCKITGKAK